MNLNFSADASAVRYAHGQSGTDTPDLSLYGKRIRDAQTAFYGYDREAYLRSRGDEYRQRVSAWHPPFEERVINEGLRAIQVTKKNASTQTDPEPPPTLGQVLKRFWAELCTLLAQ